MVDKRNGTDRTAAILEINVITFIFLSFFIGGIDAFAMFPISFFNA